jgi:NAD(P)-dependent dehydrogenase (short-subunit alcohol dehydrogenase family)
MSKERDLEVTTEDQANTPEANAIDRRRFLTTAAGGLAAAGLGAATLGANTASAKMIIPGETLKTNATKGGKRVIIINDALVQVGPPLARNFAKQGYNLVIAQPEKGLVKECESHGAKVVVVPGIEQDGPNDESQPNSTQKLVDAAMKNFGGFDSAYIRTAHHSGADILNTTAEDMQKLYESNFLAVIFALQATMPPLMEKGAGQIVILTSATSEKPFYDMLGYCTMRAAANMAVQCAAMTAAPKGVCVNAFGTNFLNYPDAIKTLGGPDKLKNVLTHIPAGRLGEPEECAHLAMAMLDGRNMYTTGQSFMIAGGYNIATDSVHFP